MSSAPPVRPAGPPLTALSGGDLRRWAFRAEAALKAYRRRIDALNVFPVPDGDTGTNLFMTLHSALEGLVGGYLTDAPAVDVVAGTQALTQHMLFSARGNSGVILSQLLRGLSDALDGVDAGTATTATDDPTGSAARREPAVDGVLAARMLRGAARAARRAVSEPVEGTILTVADAAADEAQAVAADGGALADIVDAAFWAADRALARTPAQLPPLGRAGVVDAGGAGLLVVLGALREVVLGRAADAGDYPGQTRWWVDDAPTPYDEREPDAGSGGAYEVMYLLEGCADDDADGLRAHLLRLGDSVMVVGDRRLRTVHVHVDDAGAAVEAAVGLGKLSGVRVAWLGAPGLPAGPASGTASGTAECPMGGPPPSVASPGEPSSSGGSLRDASAASPVLRSTSTGAVACAPGPGLVTAFQAAGARVADNRPGRRATTGDILEAIVGTGCAGVVVLPNDDDAMLAARAAARLAGEQGVRVVVIGTDSPVGGLAAMAVFDPDAALDDNVGRMSDAARTVRCGRVAVATRSAVTEEGPCRAGDVLGFVGDTVVALDTDPVELTVRLVDRLARADAELVTLIAGQQEPDLAERVAARLAAHRPELETTCLIGGQPVDALLVGVE